MALSPDVLVSAFFMSYRDAKKQEDIFCAAVEDANMKCRGIGDTETPPLPAIPDDVKVREEYNKALDEVVGKLRAFGDEVDKDIKRYMAEHSAEDIIYAEGYDLDGKISYETFVGVAKSLTAFITTQRTYDEIESKLVWVGALLTFSKSLCDESAQYSSRSADVFTATVQQHTRSYLRCSWDTVSCAFA